MYVLQGCYTGVISSEIGYVYVWKKWKLLANKYSVDFVFQHIRANDRYSIAHKVTNL